MTRSRYVFEETDDVQAPAKDKLPEDSWETICDALRESIIGSDAETETPFGRRRVIYADHTASGQPLGALEQQLHDRVLPLYGNVHSLTTATARQSTFFRSEARQLVKQYYNLDASYAAIFCGAGTTAAINRFVQMLENARWNVGWTPSEGSPTGAEMPQATGRVEDRWGSIECRACGVRVKSEAAYRAHCATSAHQSTVAKTGGESSKSSSHVIGPPQEGSLGHALRRINILVDPTAHHSLSLPFREAAKRSAVELQRFSSGGNGASRAAEDADAAAGETRHSAAVATAVLITVTDLKLGDGAKLCCEDLALQLHEAVVGGALPVCLLSAASNITGALQDVSAVTELVHRGSGLVCWDLAGVGGHRRPDLSPAGRPLAHVDAAFASPHKFLGGPSTCGLLLVRKALLQNEVPAVPGGGSVFFVGPDWHSYISNTEEREEAGSPDLAACARTGLCFHLHASLPRGLIENREAAYLRELLSALNASSCVEVLAPEASAVGVGTVSFVIRYAEHGLYLHHSFVSCLLNDLFGVQSRAGCACAGPYAQHLLGINAQVAADFDRALARDGCEVVRPGLSRVCVHFADSLTHAEIVRVAICWVAEHGWKLMPHYTFDVSTGEWTHRQDVRRSARDWLSGWQLPGAGGDVAVGAQQLVSAPSGVAVATSAAELVRIADATLQQTCPPASGAPLLRCPPELLWFALPQDAAWTLRRGLEAPALDPQCEPCAEAAGGARRPHKPIFSPPQHRDARITCSPVTSLDDARSTAAENVKLSKQSDKSENLGGASSSKAAKAKKQKDNGRLVPPKALLRQIHEAMADFDMIVEGDRVLLGLSGGKDSLSLLHCLLEIQRTAPIKFTIAAATVDPQAAGYDPFALRKYVNSLGVEYFVLEQPVMDRAKDYMDAKGATSICSWCSRMKRGALYSCMREQGCNVLALGQHLDDLAESFLMSAFHNGTLRTMKAHYWAESSGVKMRVIRPLVYVRESSMASFAHDAELPIITENCPACFAEPKERHNTKLLLSSVEFEHKDLFGKLLSTVTPLMDLSTSDNPFEGGLARRRGGGNVSDQKSDPKIGKKQGATSTSAQSRAPALPGARTQSPATLRFSGRDLTILVAGTALGTTLAALTLGVASISRNGRFRV